MKYDDIVKISIKILESSEIETNNLTFLYEISKKQHYDLDFELFQKMGGKGEFTHSDIINLNLNGITFKFIEKNKKLFVE